MVEEFAREAGAELAKKIPKPREAVTKFLDRVNEPVRYRYDLVKTDLPGRLKEITIRSPSTSFSLLIMVDGVKKIERSYTEMAAMSAYSDTIDAFEEVDGGVYIIHIKDINWTTTIEATLHVDDGPITFQNLWAVWNEFPERKLK